MNTNLTTIAESSHFTAVNAGSWTDIQNHVLPLPGRELKGKVFLKEALGLTGAEISFQYMEPGSKSPFMHAHKQNEEVYIILKGSGNFQVDDDVFPVVEGSVIRVAPQGERAIKCAVDSAMVYMVIQVRENSLSQWSYEDGIMSETQSRL